MTTKYLNEFRRNVTSQNGEDGVLEEIFKRIGVRNRWCVELGASDGSTDSNTWHLIHRYHWRAVLIEADLEKIRKMKDYPNENVFVVHALIGEDRSLDSLLRSLNVPKDFDLLSIDVDGEDQKIWASLTNYLPRVVVIEVDSRQAPGAEHKSGISSCVELAKLKGYELALHTGNCIFVRREYAKLLGIDTEHWEELFDRSWLGTD